MSAYDLDLHAWASEQADALRRRSANEIDWENVAEEIESLGKQQEAELFNRLVVLLSHLLKWSFQPERRGVSWTATIKEQRRRVSRHLRENPSLKPVREDIFLEAYETSRLRASRETELPDDRFPEAPRFTLAEALADDFWPDAVSSEESPR